MRNITVTLDSRGADSVDPTAMAKGVNITETASSMAKLKYRAANGTPNLNHGDKVIQANTNVGQKRERREER